MTLIEALKSGRPFRQISYRQCPWFAAGGDLGYRYDKEQILADDWEIEEEKVTVTRSQVDKLVNVDLALYCKYDEYYTFKKKILRGLGFTDAS